MKSISVYEIGDSVLHDKLDKEGVVVWSRWSNSLGEMVYLVDFGEDFDGHNGDTYDYCEYIHSTTTCQWCFFLDLLPEKSVFEARKK